MWGDVLHACLGEGRQRVGHPGGGRRLCGRNVSVTVGCAQADQTDTPNPVVPRTLRVRSRQSRRVIGWLLLVPPRRRPHSESPQNWPWLIIMSNRQSTVDVPGDTDQRRPLSPRTNGAGPVIRCRIPGPASISMRRQACLTASISRVIVTLSPTTAPPVSSGRSMSIPKSLRFSTTDASKPATSPWPMPGLTP
jgi:hypothetical protein